MPSITLTVKLKLRSTVYCILITVIQHNNEIALLNVFQYSSSNVYECDGYRFLVTLMKIDVNTLLYDCV
jgi:hypothetical protein